MDYRNILAIGFLLLCGGYFFRSLQPANAVLPPYPIGTSYNGYPYESIQCNGCTQSTPFLTVPSDKYFILTAAVSSWSTTCTIYVDGQDTMSGNVFKGFRNGNARLVIPPNSGITTDQSDCYVEGYYANPNNINLESLYGLIGANSTATLLSVPNDKNLIITGGQIGGSWNNSLYSDNDLVILGEKLGNDAYDNVFQDNNGHLKIPAGTDLKIVNSNSQSQRYYLQGYYAPL